MVRIKMCKKRIGCLRRERKRMDKMKVMKRKRLFGLNGGLRSKNCRVRYHANYSLAGAVDDSIDDYKCTRKVRVSADW